MNREKRKALLRQLLDERGLGSRAALAAHCNVSANTVYKWVEGEYWPRSEDEKKLWSFFGYRLEQGKPIPEAKKQEVSGKGVELRDVVERLLAEGEDEALAHYLAQGRLLLQLSQLRKRGAA